MRRLSHSAAYQPSRPQETHNRASPTSSAPMTSVAISRVRHHFGQPKARLFSQKKGVRPLPLRYTSSLSGPSRVLRKNTLFESFFTKKPLDPLTIRARLPYRTEGPTPSTAWLQPPPHGCPALPIHPHNYRLKNPWIHQIDMRTTPTCLLEP
jgi:hypothetical protein